MKTFLLRKKPSLDGSRKGMVMVAVADRAAALWGMIDEIDDPSLYEYAVADHGVVVAAPYDGDIFQGARPSGSTLLFSSTVIDGLDDEEEWGWDDLVVVRDIHAASRPAPASNVIRLDAIAPMAGYRAVCEQNVSQARALANQTVLKLSEDETDQERLHAVFLLSALADSLGDMAREILLTIPGDMEEKQKMMQQYRELQRDQMSGSQT